MDSTTSTLGKNVGSVGPFSRDDITRATKRAYDSIHPNDRFADLPPDEQNAFIGKSVSVMTSGLRLQGSADLPQGVTVEDKKFASALLPELRRHASWDEDEYARGYIAVDTSGKNIDTQPIEQSAR